MHSSKCGCLIIWVHTMPHETIYVRMYIHIMTLLHILPYTSKQSRGKSFTVRAKMKIQRENFHGRSLIMNA